MIRLTRTVLWKHRYPKDILKFPHQRLTEMTRSGELIRGYPCFLDHTAGSSGALFNEREDVNHNRLLTGPVGIMVSITAWLFLSLLFCITLGLAAKGN